MTGITVNITLLFFEPLSIFGLIAVNFGRLEIIPSFDLLLSAFRLTIFSWMKTIQRRKDAGTL
jgi:hypothetical protein